MSDINPTAPVIEAEKPRPCGLCRFCKETRPYGEGGTRICFDCAMLDERLTRSRFRALATFGRVRREGNQRTP